MESLTVVVGLFYGGNLETVSSKPCSECQLDDRIKGNYGRTGGADGR